MCDLTVTDLSYAVTSAFYCGKLVLACSTYDGGLFPPMKTLEPKRAENKAEKAAVNGSAEDATCLLYTSQVLPGIIFLGGFFITILWEAKSRYVYPLSLIHI